MKLTSTRFIIMTAHSGDKIVKQAGGEGALGFLVKPLDPKELLAQVHVGLTRAAEISDLQSSLIKGVSSARTVSTAIGILIERLSMTRAEATQFITNEAKNQRKRMVDLAESLISEREQDFRARDVDRWWLAGLLGRNDPQQTKS